MRKAVQLVSAMTLLGLCVGPIDAQKSGGAVPRNTDRGWWRDQRRSRQVRRISWWGERSHRCDSNRTSPRRHGRLPHAMKFGALRSCVGGHSDAAQRDAELVNVVDAYGTTGSRLETDSTWRRGPRLPLRRLERPLHELRHAHAFGFGLEVHHRPVPQHVIGARAHIIEIGNGPSFHRGARLRA